MARIVFQIGVWYKQRPKPKYQKFTQTIQCPKNFETNQKLVLGLGFYYTKGIRNI